MQPQQGPPTVPLMLTSGWRGHPDQVTLADAAMTAGFLRACGQIYTADLKDAGWPIPG